jgi:1-acyl-sn-glycerol-3-phosphate acyltransferase
VRINFNLFHIAANAARPKKKLRENRFLFSLYQVYKWLIVIPMAVILAAITGLFAFPVIWIFGQKAGQIGGRIWSRLCSLITPMTVSVTGRENIDPKQSYIIAANHQSQYDIFAIYGWLPIDFRWVMKIELRKVPIFGAYSEHAGHICIDRSNPLKAMQSINRAKEKLAAGTSIFFFPEGTRSRDGELLPFKMGAFRLALDMQLPILPITISGTRDILPSGTLKLFPGHVRIIVHKPIDIREFNDQTIVQLAHRTRFAIQNGLTEDKVAHS